MKSRNFENIRDLINENSQLNVIVNVEDFNMDELIKFAQISTLFGNNFTFTNCMTLSKENLKKIAKSGKNGNITFDLR